MENNKTLKLTGLTEEEVDKLLLIFTKSNEDIYDSVDLAYELRDILLDREVSIHFDTINNKDHIIRF